MSTARFNLRFTACVLAVSAAVVAFDVAVDPYLVFGRPRVAGFNAIKPAAATRERLMKAYDAPRHAAKTLIIGSSRSDIGIRPASEAWPSALQPVYNLSLAGSGTGTGLLYLRNQIAREPATSEPRLVVVGLDFEYALATPPSVAVVAGPGAVRGLSETEERMSVLADGTPNGARRWRVAKDYLLSAFSLESLSDSVATLIANRRTSAADLAADGQLAETVLAGSVAADGPNTMFLQKNRQFVEQYREPHQTLVRRTDGSPSALEPVDALLAFARQRGMTVVLFVQAAHADRLELLDRLGYWDDYETWKSALTRLVDDHRKRGLPVKLFDFGDYESYALEAVPPADDRRSALRWFWEPAHYKSSLGDRMIQRMTGDATAPGIGVELTPDNLADHLARVRAARAAYRRDMPLAAARLDAIVCATTSCTASQTKDTATR